MRALLALLLPVAGGSGAAEPFREDFSRGIDPERWVVSTWTAPRSDASNRSSFAAGHVSVRDGALCLKLVQARRADGTFVSTGAEITSTAKFGHGTYEFVVKASSDSPDPSEPGRPVAGSITGISQFLDSSATEIDVEVEGIAARSALTQTSTWTHEERPSETHHVPPADPGDAPHARFHTYRYVWAPGSVRFFRDGVLISTHTRVVPELPAPVILNHWGTNHAKWGGEATPGARYVFVRSFSFTPLGGE